MCIDFWDLNKACPKDFYPLPRIDQLVDSTSRCELLSMMDVSQGHHQIMLASKDHKRVSFITSDGTFCYVAMPFGLKNAGATYQRLVDKIFRPQLSRNMEEMHIWGQRKAFPRIHGNPTRYRGQPSQDQEKGLPFFKTLRNVKDFEWTEKCQQAFEELKAYLAKLPLLVKPISGDTLYLYLSSTSQAVSSVLVREEDGARTPIYYVSKVLNRAECRYPSIEKMVLALVITARKLRLYFLSYPVGVRTNTP
ncbi:UNVERIFIED_CONTAM: Retrovirus-related Pol polyprotein from transposon [Sesamum calycinum]|uniref:Retrovirus-related Pol polyprotein from transposon n=1 Tax=Sesamum calycinum TaxID=2727403 RepID=A0AAW2NY75_9LAMI